MNTIARWLETFGALLANAGSLVVAQVRNFLVVSFWVLICLAICVGVGLIFQLQPLVVVPVLVIALITAALFMATRVVARVFPTLEGLACVVGGFALWLFFLGFLTSIHPEWFYLSTGNFQSLMVFGTAGLFVSFFLSYIGSKSNVTSYTMVVVVLLFTLAYGLETFRPGLYDRLTATRPNQPVTTAQLKFDAVGYDLQSGDLKPLPNVMLRAGQAVAVIDTLPREFGGEQFISCMLPNERGDFVGGRTIWVPLRKLDIRQGFSEGYQNGFKTTYQDLGDGIQVQRIDLGSGLRMEHLKVPGDPLDSALDTGTPVDIQAWLNRSSRFNAKYGHASGYRSADELADELGSRINENSTGLYMSSTQDAIAGPALAAKALGKPLPASWKWLSSPIAIQTIGVPLTELGITPEQEIEILALAQSTLIPGQETETLVFNPPPVTAEENSMYHYRSRTVVLGHPSRITENGTHCYVGKDEILARSDPKSVEPGMVSIRVLLLPEADIQESPVCFMYYRLKRSDEKE
ncbi:MAG: hypothetical protein A2840_01660 [Candidatus Buchananbacteria bacterium RIFCSPHIGHO2_01_FULL_47_11b]|uniref:Uncharacterized protein n=1 Tax=Candidatus Buchananbacteria bacterium RIFCSPHIGHO2_01_FULL_47_11b TaxID=1797537 RepID=A0A1G1Y4Q7_9BACT|nr:MAG: hypothetical protein A2840_01660 [Candidatus Buchananbacteria bacterium RIFCSPHIGHO2_01_FULL_47_11b]